MSDTRSQWVVVGAFGVFAVVVGVGLALMMQRPSAPPPLEPAPEPAVDPSVLAEAEEAVEQALIRAALAHTAGDGAGFLAEVDVDRAVEYVQARAPSVESSFPIHDALERLFARQPEEATKTTGTTWRDLVVRRVEVDVNAGEAVAYAQFRDGVRSVIRVWLAERGGVWRLYDWQDLSLGVKFLDMLALSFEEAAKGNALVEQALRRLEAGRQALLDENAARAVQALTPLAGLMGCPPMLRALAMVLLATAHLELGGYAESLAALEHARSLEPDLPMAWSLTAEAYLGQGKFGEAIEAAEQGLAQLGDDPDALRLMGAGHEGLGELDVARQRYREGVELDPGDVVCRVSLCRLALRAGDEVEAAQWLDDALTVSDAETVIYQAQQLMRWDKDAEALGWIAGEVAKAEPDSTLARYRHGEALKKLGDLEGARAVFSSLVEDHPDTTFHDCEIELVRVCSALGRFDEAYARADRLEETGEGQLVQLAWFYRALIAARQGDAAACARSLERSIALGFGPVLRNSPRDPEVLELRQVPEAAALLDALED